jgi:iron complex outermembrane recepter protein
LPTCHQLQGNTMASDRSLSRLAALARWRWPLLLAGARRRRAGAAGRTHHHHHRPQRRNSWAWAASATCRWRARRCRPRVIGPRSCADAGMASLADITRLDAGVTDAYNAEGYWGQLAVRGFTLDNRFNYRRDGLPINAETVLPWATRSALELLKGTSGIQAGTSAPGGLVNLVVKRPHRARCAGGLELVRGGTLARARSTCPSASAPTAPSACAQRQPPSAWTRRCATPRASATCWRWRATGASADTCSSRVEPAASASPARRLQPAGRPLPDARAIDPRINLNNQPWSPAGGVRGRTGSLRSRSAWASDWRSPPTRCSSAAHRRPHRLPLRLRRAEPTSTTTATAATAASTSTTSAAKASAAHRRARPVAARPLRTGGLAHRSAPACCTRARGRFNRQAYNYAGPGTHRRHAPWCRPTRR